MGTEVNRYIYGPAKVLWGNLALGGERVLYTLKMREPSVKSAANLF